MFLSNQTITQALSALSPTDQSLVLSSRSVTGARPALTKFAVALGVYAAAQLNLRSATLYASFTGSATGRKSPKSTAKTVNPLYAQALALCGTHLTFKSKSFLLDVVVATPKPIIHLSIESEATSISSNADLHDLQKLLAVASPHRVYVGRVNTAGNGLKVSSAVAAIQTEIATARYALVLRPADKLDVILIQTGGNAQMQSSVTHFSA